MPNRKAQDEPPSKWTAAQAADGDRHEAELRQGQLVWTLTVALGVAVLALYQITSNRTPLAVGSLSGVPNTFRTFNPLAGDPSFADDLAPVRNGAGRAPASVSAARQPLPATN